ncbi:EAL domain-containing protein [Pseudomonas sp. B2M1-30]|uniref:EAL domain-containing protein n=1 Tax=Pseudomonas TaxID=286 RepID=UPI0021C6E16A|nr:MULTISPECIES: EAL domain-containing protein [Pseudomonas]MCU0121742.1 EAL domain-containing protein [Pseudomonas sp. B2M1-30]MCU7263870.1 EAL domain-containing protein [Pseudomonas koreensis]
MRRFNHFNPTWLSYRIRRLDGSSPLASSETTTLPYRAVTFYPVQPCALKPSSTSLDRWPETFGRADSFTKFPWLSKTEEDYLLRKLAVPRGLRTVLATALVFQCATLILSFWLVTSNQSSIGTLSNVAVDQVDAVAETVQHLMEARLSLSRANTRIVLFNSVPQEMVQHARMELTLANESFDRFLTRTRVDEENHIRVQALKDVYSRYVNVLNQLLKYTGAGDVQWALAQPVQDIQEEFLLEQKNFIKYGNSVSKTSLQSMGDRFEIYMAAAAMILFLVLATTFFFLYIIKKVEKSRLLKIAVNRTDSAIVVTNSSGIITYVNEGFVRMLGYEASDLVGKKPDEVFYGRHTDQDAIFSFRNSIQSGVSHTTELLVYNKSKNPLWVRVVANPVLDPEGVQQDVVAIVTDITEAKMNDELQFKVLSAMAREESLPDVMKLICLEIGRIAPEIGVSIRQFDERGCLPLVAEFNLPEGLIQSLENLAERSILKKMDAQQSIMLNFTDPASYTGDCVDHELSQSLGFTAGWINTIRSNNGRILGTLTLYYRESHLPAAQQYRLLETSLKLCALALERDSFINDIERLAYYDSLTMLPNRRMLMMKANAMIANAQRAQSSMAVLFIDINKFKQINDSLGHAAGDLLLSEIARRLQGSVRGNDFVSRLSGDEFVIILSPSNAEQSIAFSERMMSKLAEPMMLNDVKVVPSASIGIGIYPDHGSDIQSLLLHADQAMYKAKSAGRQVIEVFDPVVTPPVEDELTLSLAVKDVLASDQLAMHYQPQIMLDDYRLFGVEALVRWCHPQLGDIPPSRFIPLMRDEGMMPELNRWVLTEACRQMVQWRDAGLVVPHMSVNIFPVAFRDRAIVEFIQTLLARHELSPSCLTLEVTEDFILDATDTVISVITEVRQLGVSLSIDDFGTGYSSLSYLLRLPVNAIKLDKSFIDDIEKSASARTLVQSIAGICHSLQLNIVAEGVETEGQLEILRNLGYHVAQGYCFSRPLEPEDLALWVHERSHSYLSRQ